MYRISSRQQSSSCRWTYRLNVITIQHDSFASQLVNVWSFYFRTVKTYITPAEVIHQNEQNIRLWWSWGDERVKICWMEKNKNAEEKLHCCFQLLLHLQISHALSRYLHKVNSWPKETSTHIHVSMMSCKSSFRCQVPSRLLYLAVRDL